MRYTQLVKEVAAMHDNITQEMVKNVLQTVVAIAERELANGGSISIDNLLKIEMKEQKGRKGIIRLGDRAGQPFNSPDMIVPKIKIAPRFKVKVSKEA